MKRTTLEVLKNICLLGFGCALLGFGSCNHPITMAQESEGRGNSTLKKCAHQKLPMARLLENNQIERKE